MQVEADALQHALQFHGRVRLQRRRGAVEAGEALAVLHADAVGAGLPAGVVQQGGGGFRVVLVHLLGAGPVAGRAFGERAIGGFDQAEEEIVRQVLAVHGHGQGAADLDVLEDAFAGVEFEAEGDAGGVADHGAVALVVAQALEVEHRGGIDEVDFAGFQGGDAGGGVWDEAMDQALDLGGAAIGEEGGRPVIGVEPLDDDLGAIRPGDEAERAGADRGAGEALVAEFLHGGGRDGRQCRVREAGQGGAEGLGVADADGVRVDHVAAGIGAELGDGAFAGEFGIDDAVIGEFRGGGVEWRAVVEADALAQLEGDAQAVLRHLPACGEAGIEFVAAVAGDQRVEELADELPFMAGAGDAGIVGAGAVVVLAPGDGEAGAGLGAGAAQDEGRGERAADDAAARHAGRSGPNHVPLPLCWWQMMGGRALGGKRIRACNMGLPAYHSGAAAANCAGARERPCILWLGIAIAGA